MKAVFNLARMLQPAVIFFDEIDALMSARKVLVVSHCVSLRVLRMQCGDGLNRGEERSAVQPTSSSLSSECSFTCIVLTSYRLVRHSHVSPCPLLYIHLQSI
jgi:SpoVK/Ycf46/Vps4 family AAA+-type ATPase